MTEPARKLRDTYAITPGAAIYRSEFGYYCLEQWYQQGLDREADLAEIFDYDPGATFDFSGLGWCEAAFDPYFESKILEDRGEHELVQDWAGRGVLVFKGRRNGFMPEYVDHPVKDMKSWQENCKWRLDPDSPERWKDFDKLIDGARTAAGRGDMVRQMLVGGYMYLRSLIGPVDLMYAWYDMPEVVHDCMQTWLTMADAVTARHQEHLTFDETFLAEDICYNTGPLCSPETMREFLLPYYEQLIANIKGRQIDRTRHMYVQIDTDGRAPSVIDLYRKSIGMDVMSPFEVASGCDVVAIGRQYPDLAMFGGIDKRVLAKTKADIDEMLERIIPPMRARGGYIPTCDHGVPEEVTLDNYLHYRRRCVELGG
ncbi:MAG TPA: hypothetical protein ENH80_13750 [Phycisphaerae bacterium]|nr:hypothetical protein [Phycisphaerae bacterium]HDZ44993.1 hypothetical protein [Phycisphaerae bacterium]